jgi:hypothetical protein
MSGVTFDRNGSLYGVTAYGGSSTQCYGISCGTAFKLTPTQSGPWTHSVLYTFGGGTDGGNPMSSLILDASGNLYGTTGIGSDPSCGSEGCGTIYLLHLSQGTWEERILHRFTGGDDGVGPRGLVFGKKRALYGVAARGMNSAGLVFSLSR